MLYVQLAAAATLACFMWAADSAGADSGQPAPSQTEAQAIIAKADSVFNTRQYVTARHFYEKALIAAQAVDHKSDMTQALAMIARTYLVEDEYEVGFQWLLKAEKLANIDEPAGWSRYQAVKGRFLWKNNRLDESTALFKTLYEYCIKQNLYERAVDAAHMVAITGTPQEQVEWGKKGIDQAMAGNVTAWLGPLWNNLGATYEEMGRFDSSLEAYRKAREYHYSHGTDRNKVLADYAVGHALCNLKKYEAAGQWLRPVLTKFEEMREDEFIGLTCRDLGEISYVSGDYKEAHALFVRAGELLKKADMDTWDSAGYSELILRIDETKAKME